MLRRTCHTIFASLLLVALAMGGVCLGAEPKRKKLPPVPLPLLPATDAWVATLDDLPSAGGAMDAERVYIPIQPESIVALSRATGMKVWTRNIESVWPPVVVGGTVYVAASDEIHALDAETGAERWRVSYETAMIAPLSAATMTVGKAPGPAVMPHPVLIGILAKGIVVSYELADGRMRWRQDMGAASTFLPASDGERAIFALEDSRVVALSLADGHVDWEQKFDGMLNQPAFSRDRVFVGTNTNILYALDNDNGRIVWRWKTGGDVLGASGDTKGGAYYASLDNVLRAVNRGNGNQRWIKEIPTRPLLPPQTFGDGVKNEEIVVLTGVTSEVDAFAAKSGALVGKYNPPSDLEGPPLVDPNLKPYAVAMVVITRDGRAIGLTPTAMLFAEPTDVPFTTELPGRKLERERIIPSTR